MDTMPAFNSHGSRVFCECHYCSLLALPNYNYSTATVAGQNSYLQQTAPSNSQELYWPQCAVAAAAADAYQMSFREHFLNGGASSLSLHHQYHHYAQNTSVNPYDSEDLKPINRFNYHPYECESALIQSSSAPQNQRQIDKCKDNQEEVLWRRGLLGNRSPQQLLETLIFLFSKHPGLQSRDRLRALRTGNNSQISFRYDACRNRYYLEYQEDASFEGVTNDNSIGSLMSGTTDVHQTENLVQSKSAASTRTLTRGTATVRMYDNPDNLERCIVKLYGQYLTHRLTISTSSLFLVPLNIPQDDIWYSSRPIGVHRITSIRKKLLSLSGLQKEKTKMRCSLNGNSSAVGKQKSCVGKRGATDV